MPIRTITHTQNPVDISANQYGGVEIEIQKEIGFSNSFKLYVHIEGQTFVRICKLRAKDFNLDRTVIKEILGTKKL